MRLAAPRGDTERGMGHLEPQTLIAFVVAVWLMVDAGLSKKQLRLRQRPICPYCHHRHASGNCLRSN